MKREHNIFKDSELYLFNFPLTEDGVNYGNLPESQYIGNLRNYGSTSNTPNFNDNLGFDSTYGELAHRHTGCADKLVSLIDYNNFDINAWMNTNDYELNIDFYFTGYNGYQQVLELMRNPNHQTANDYFVGYDVRWAGSTFGYLSHNGTTSDMINLRNSGSSVSNAWIRFRVVKSSGNLTITFDNLTSGTNISTKILAWPTLYEGKNPCYMTIFGYYQDPTASNYNSQRYCAGATKNFYLKKTVNI